MTRQIVFHPQTSNKRRQLLLHDQPPPGGKRFGEVVGGAAAECAAVACCCPCGIVDLLVLAVYKIPAGLCRKALHKRKTRKLKGGKGLLKERPCTCEETELHLHPVAVEMLKVDQEEKAADDSLTEKEVMELEKEMWDKFSAGFWRSASQRASICSDLPIANFTTAAMT